MKVSQVSPLQEGINNGIKAQFRSTILRNKLHSPVLSSLHGQSCEFLHYPQMLHLSTMGSVFENRSWVTILLYANDSIGHTSTAVAQVGIFIAYQIVVWIQNVGVGWLTNLWFIESSCRIAPPPNFGIDVPLISGNIFHSHTTTFWLSHKNGDQHFGCFLAKGHARAIPSFMADSHFVAKLLWSVWKKEEKTLVD